MAQVFCTFAQREIMDTPDPIRNRPADEGKRNDPHVRDESAPQPGVNTLSSSDTDSANQEITETTADNFREAKPDSKADPDLDQGPKES